MPREQILIENKSTNTGENIDFSYRLLQKQNIPVQRLLLVQKPYMERRTFATFLKQWPGPDAEICVTSPQIPFSEYPNQEVTLPEVIHIMIGDLQRIQVYPQLGFQVPQEIPEKVWQAFEALQQKGFTNHLLP
ncbi:MAG: YdcF family protein [Rufibacter sp.]